MSLSEYLQTCRNNNILVNTSEQHNGSINSLCMEGKLIPVEFTAYDGIRRKANCMLTACDWLKANGQYKEEQTKLVIWH